MNTSLKKTLIEGVIAELVQFCPQHCFMVVYLRFILNCYETSYAYKEKW